MTRESKSRIRFLLPTNRHLAEDTTTFLRGSGFLFNKRHPRQLYGVCEVYDTDLFFVRAGDIPWYLAQGAGDLGITGYDLLYEHGAQVEPLLELSYGFCRLSVGVPEDSPYRSIACLAGTRVVTSHPNAARTFFAQRGIDVEIVTLKGALEVAPRLGVCEAIVSLVATGVTNVVNGIRIIADILPSQAVLVGKLSYPPWKRQGVERIRAVLSDAVEAQMGIAHIPQVPQ